MDAPLMMSWFVISFGEVVYLLRRQDWSRIVVSVFLGHHHRLKFDLLRLFRCSVMDAFDPRHQASSTLNACLLPHAVFLDAVSPPLLV